MVAYIQILVPLLCVLLAQGHFIHRESSQFSSSQNFDKLRGSDGVEVRTILNPLNPDLDAAASSDDRPIDGNVYSYNNQHSYDDYYHDSNYNPGGYPYYGYPGYFNSQNYDNMPFGYPNIYNGYPGMDQRPEYGDILRPYEQPGKHDDTTDGKITGKDDKNHDHQQSEQHKDKSKPADKISDGTSPKTDKNDNIHESSKKDSVPLKQKKDFLLVDNNGNTVYLLHENTPNGNPIAVPNNNQPAGNNIVYVPYNPQQPRNQIYEMVSTQPPVPTNIPMTANRVNLSGYNNVITNPAQNNNPGNNNSPSYVLLYANGQLIKIPGIVVNPSQNVAPIQNGNSGSNSNVMYVRQPNQGNNPIFVQVPNPLPSNVALHPGSFVANPQYVANPNAIPNNVVNYPNTVSQPPPAVLNNNGYVPPNGMYNVANPMNVNPAVPVNNPPNGMYNVANPLNVNQAVPVNNPVVAVNNPSVHPAYALTINGNQGYQPAQEKETNPGTPAPNNVPAPVSNPINSPATQPPATINNTGNTMGIQPAVMVSGFKEKDSDAKNKKKGVKDTKEIKKEKDDSKKEAGK